VRRNQAQGQPPAERPGMALPARQELHHLGGFE
jgi:hypothetical protein